MEIIISFCFWGFDFSNMENSRKFPRVQRQPNYNYNYSFSFGGFNFSNMENSRKFSGVQGHPNE